MIVFQRGLNTKLLTGKEFKEFEDFLRLIGVYDIISDGEWHLLRMECEVYVDGTSVETHPKFPEGVSDD